MLNRLLKANVWRRWEFWTLLVTVIGLAVVIVQTGLTKRQLDIIVEQMAQRSKLVAEVESESKGTYFTTSFVAHNVGNKTTRDFYYQVCLPVNEVRQQLMPVEQFFTPSQAEMQIDGVTCKRYGGHSAVPVFPKSRLLVGTFNIEYRDVTGPFRVWWRFVGEDGEETGTLTVTPPAR
jgi:hypothetical protein